MLCGHPACEERSRGPSLPGFGGRALPGVVEVEDGWLARGYVDLILGACQAWCPSGEGSREVARPADRAGSAGSAQNVQLRGSSRVRRKKQMRIITRQRVVRSDQKPVYAHHVEEPRLRTPQAQITIQIQIQIQIRIRIRMRIDRCICGVCGGGGGANGIRKARLTCSRPGTPRHSTFRVLSYGTRGGSSSVVYKLSERDHGDGEGRGGEGEVMGGSSGAVVVRERLSTNVKS